ncbi:MAG: DoxX family protein [Verrucomicrobia bacterium]|nr:DoxX family protein [Verrucomicrobiota bacterium]
MLRSFIAFLGRVCLSLFFLGAALNKILDWTGAEQYFIQALGEGIKSYIGSPGIEQLLEWALADHHLLLLAAVTIELLCGLMIFLGLWVRLAAFLLFIFLVPTTLLFHHFWDLMGVDRDLQMGNFLKNVAIMGGLLLLLAYGKGKEKPAVNDKKPSS